MTPLAAQVFLALCGAVCAFCAVVAVRRTGRVFNLKSVILVNYLIVYPVSGLISLSSVNSSHGYFSYNNLPRLSAGPALTTAVIVNFVALGSLVVALRPGMRQVARPHEVRMSRQSRTVFVAIALVLALPAVASVRRLSSYAGMKDLSRIISLSGGMARYSYLANWLNWVIAFLLLCLLTGKLFTSDLAKVALLTAAFAAMAVGLHWNGGRSVLVIYALPLLLAALPTLRRRAQYAVAVIAGIGGIALATELTSKRLQGTTFGQTQSVLGQVFDWQYGRFSMQLWSYQYVHDTGFQFGRTILSGISSVPRSVTAFLGLGNLPTFGMPVTAITGKYFLGDASASSQYIVPGLSAEMYLNLGLVGVVVGYAGLGALVRWCDGRLDAAADFAPRLLFAYLGTLLIFQTLTASAGALVGYFFLNGLPLIVAVVIVKVMTAAPRTAPLVSSVGPLFEHTSSNAPARLVMAGRPAYESPKSRSER
jgi:hypothetical protein